MKITKNEKSIFENIMLADECGDKITFKTLINQLTNVQTMALFCEQNQLQNAYYLRANFDFKNRALLFNAFKNRAIDARAA